MAKPLYRIEIEGIRAEPDATRMSVFKPLAGFFARLARFCE
ncbi:hypothetical protein [Treponema endosymbiont of Eucomonympha sp.]|nr:hypothetical protein [Treponema endosymbiont of Eucomonympha sp.]